MAIAKIIYKENASSTPEVWMDTTDKTAASGNMLSGTTALKNDGSTATGNIATKTSSDMTVSGATVTAPAGYYASDASKSVSTATQATPSISVNSSTGVITASATQTAGYVSAGTKSATEQLSTQAGTTVSPTESEQTAVAAGKYTLGAVKVGAISSTYVGSGVTQNDSDDLSASGATVTAPAGYYSQAASKSVASGSATTPATSITANPSISVSSGGLITASVSASKSVTPTVSAGYVSSGTAGTVSVSGSNTEQLSTQAAQTIHPSTTDQTIASGKYLTGAQTVKAVTTTNLTAANIVSGVTVKVGDSTDDDCVASVTGTASSGYSETLMKNYISRSGYFTDIEWPEGLTNIGYGAFASCTGFNPSSLPSGITNISQYAFYCCYELALTSLPSGITNISQYAFYYCYKLALTSLPSGVTSIQPYAFYNCYELALTSLPSGVTAINSNGFSSCYNLALTSLPSGVTYIESYAFRNCEGITTISCDGAITTLGSNVFNGSSSHPMQLASASFPNMAISSLSTVFGSSTAANACQLLAFADIGSTQGIASNAFANCYALQTLVLRRTSAICSLSNVSAFLNTPLRGYNGLTAEVYVPNDLISTYQSATNWSTLYNDGTITFKKIEGSDYDLS